MYIGTVIQDRVKINNDHVDAADDDDDHNGLDSSFADLRMLLARATEPGSLEQERH